MSDKNKVTENDFKKAMLETLSAETTQEELRTLLKLCLDSGKRVTYSMLLEMDATYKRQDEMYKEALSAFEALDLTDGQREIVENLIAKTDELAYEANLIAYEAGILDGYRMLKKLGVTNE